MDGIGTIFKKNFNESEQLQHLKNMHRSAM